MLNLTRTLKTGYFNRALFCTQIATTNDESSYKLRAGRVLDIKERNEKLASINKSGFDNKEIDSMIESGPGNEQRTKFFKSIARVHKNDHPEIRATKHKIKALLHRELEEQKMLDKITEAERRSLEEDTQRNVKERKSFFFKYDANKVKNNTRVYNAKAPGNPARHPSVVLDHQHVDIQHYIDVNSLTPEKL